MAIPKLPFDIKTYGDLKKSICIFQNRDDDEFITNLHLFINMAEKEIYRSVSIPPLVREIYLPVRKGQAFVPADYLEMKYMINTDTGKPCKVTSPENIFRMNEHNYARDDKDIYYARLGNRFMFAPLINTVVPDDTSGTDIFESPEGIICGYLRDTAELKQDDEGNELLTIAPDLFLYTCLKHSSAFCYDWENADKWATLAAGASATLQIQVDREKFSGSPLRMNLVGQGWNSEPE